jgi:hypothetical protein
MVLLFSISSLGYSQNIKGLYVDGFYTILGDPIQEDALLTYAQSTGFNYLILYNAAKIQRKKYAFSNPKGSAVWQAFIVKAKTKYGIKKIGLVGEKAKSFTAIAEYNARVHYQSQKRIDVFNLEFEFWNRRLYGPNGYYGKTYLLKNNYPCTEEGAFRFYLKQLKVMNQLKGKPEIEIESYIGNPSRVEIFKMAPLLDRLLVHYYRSKVEQIARYKINRLIDLQKANPNLKLVPIFSSRENHLGPWLKKHPMHTVDQDFYQQLKAIYPSNYKALNIKGFIWYRYSDMPKN